MKLWEYRIKQYTYNLEKNKVQERSKQNYVVEEILSDFGKDGYELVNVITEPIINDNNSESSEFLRTFFLRKKVLRYLLLFLSLVIFSDMTFIISYPSLPKSLKISSIS